jgi:hypothetical protein
MLDYTRLGSEAYGGTILDKYSVSYQGLERPVLLYIDEYSFSELDAPRGFLCKEAFPIKAPENQ